MAALLSALGQFPSSSSRFVVVRLDDGSQARHLSHSGADKLLLYSYAGEDTPKCVFPTPYVSVPSTSPDSPPSYVHGNGIHLYRPNASVHSFISDGIITDWDAATRAIDHAFTERMRLKNLEEFPFLHTEVSWNTKENKEKMCELAFEKWGAPAYYAVDKAVMSAYVSPFLLLSLQSRLCLTDALPLQLRRWQGFRSHRRRRRRARDDYSHLRRLRTAERSVSAAPTSLSNTS